MNLFVGSSSLSLLSFFGINNSMHWIDIRCPDEYGIGLGKTLWVTRGPKLGWFPELNLFEDCS